jgi:serine protease
MTVRVHFGMKEISAIRSGAWVLACCVLGCASFSPAAYAGDFPGCEKPAPAVTSESSLEANAKRAGARIRPATERVEATSESIAEALERLGGKAREECSLWADKAFEEFEQSTYKEPFEDGKYIVNGDMAIADRERLRDFFESRIKQAPSPPALGALVVHKAGGRDAVWDATLKKQLTYCVSNTFGERRQRVVEDMEAATRAWEEAADVDFIHLETEDADCAPANTNVVFDVRPVEVDGQYLARAFFPNEDRVERNLLVDESAFALPADEALQLVGILRHELGHVLGWRHEHTRPESGTCFEDNNWRPLTAYDRFSVMHYPQCNGGGDWSLNLTDLDKNGAACVYGAAPGFQIDPQVCPQGG